MTGTKNFAIAFAFIALSHPIRAIEFTASDDVFKVSARGNQIYRCTDGKAELHRAEAELYFGGEFVGLHRFTAINGDNNLKPTWDFFARNRRGERQLQAIARTISDQTGKTVNVQRGSDRKLAGSVRVELPPVEKQEAEGNLNCLNPNLDRNEGRNRGGSRYGNGGTNQQYRNNTDFDLSGLPQWLQDYIMDILGQTGSNGGSNSNDGYSVRFGDGNNNNNSQQGTDPNGDPCTFTGFRNERETLGNVANLLLDSRDTSGLMNDVKQVIRDNTQNGNPPTVDRDGNPICDSGDSDEDIESFYTSDYRFGF